MPIKRLISILLLLTLVIGIVVACQADSVEEAVEATGGSDWKKYMHPKYQRRIFYPKLWSKEELDNW